MLCWFLRRSVKNIDGYKIQRGKQQPGSDLNAGLLFCPPNGSQVPKIDQVLLMLTIKEVHECGNGIITFLI